MTPFKDPNVGAVFDAHAPGVRKRSLALRELVFRTAAETEGCGTVIECLKWGQPAYLTERSKSGTAIPIDAVKDDSEACGIFAHCQTRLIPMLRDIYEGELDFEGNRAIRFAADRPPPEAIVKHCLTLALTYRVQKRRQRNQVLRVNNRTDHSTTVFAASSRACRREATTLPAGILSRTPSAPSVFSAIPDSPETTHMVPSL